MWGIYPTKEGQDKNEIAKQGVHTGEERERERERERWGRKMDIYRYYSTQLVFHSKIIY